MKCYKVGSKSQNGACTATIPSYFANFNNKFFSNINQKYGKIPCWIFLYFFPSTRDLSPSSLCDPECLCRGSPIPSTISPDSRSGCWTLHPIPDFRFWCSNRRLDRPGSEVPERSQIRTSCSSEWREKQKLFNFNLVNQLNEHQYTTKYLCRALGTADSW